MPQTSFKTEIFCCVFSYLHMPTAGRLLALCLGMEIKITARMLQHLSKQIASGKVLWALLTLNEYSASYTDPLIKCLRLKAAKALKPQNGLMHSEICVAILEGKRYSDFNLEEQNEIRNYKETAAKTPAVRKSVTLTDYSKRKALRQQYSNIHFSSKPSNRWSSRTRSYVFVNSTKREASSAD